MTPPELYAEAKKRGLWLECMGDKLAIIPKGKCPPDFAETLRQHKRELLAWLEGANHNLSKDRTPWLYVARQVLAGEFDGADKCMIESLTIGLRAIQHPLCRDALARLPDNREKSRA